MAEERKCLFAIFGTLVALTVIALFVCVDYAYAVARAPPPPPISSPFTEDCKPAIEIIGRLIVEKHERPWKVATVEGVDILITYNSDTHTASFLADCGMGWGHPHAGVSSPVATARVLFSFTDFVDADISKLPGTKL